MNAMVAVEIPLVGDARHKNWAKIVENVDESKSSGWAFDGEFIAAGGIQDVPVGSIIMVYGERGSRANPQIEARVFIANGDGTLSHEQSATGRAWARTLRDRVSELLDEATAAPFAGLAWDPEIMRYSDEAIVEESRRRNLEGGSSMSYAEVNGARLHIREQGSGAVALFIHGFPLDSTMWIDQLDALSDLRRCIAPDLRGFGRSSPVTGDPLTMEELADDMASILDLVSEEQADVIGLSMGGYVAMAFAERHPQRLRSLALIDTRSGADSAQGKASRDAMAAHLVQEGRTAIADAMQAGLLGPDAPIKVQARLRSMVEGCPYETIVAALGGMRDRPDRTAGLASIAVPTAVIVGEQDGVTPPAESELMAAELSNCSLTVVPDSGHLTSIEQPVAVNVALRQLLLADN
jgi:pimeloyl-ACP methyl ester carboxylesterase